MRRYDDIVEVTRGPVHGIEAPQEFRWRGWPWQVVAVVDHSLETGAWWASESARDVIGTAESQPAPRAVGDLLDERERWRVEARRRSVARATLPARTGVFDLTLDPSDGRWRLVGCAD
ncbi:MAG: DUF6504 family protein [Nocardioides sp.]|nr:DUF6504 family protein [Nocardioides sp.]